MALTMYLKVPKLDNKELENFLYKIVEMLSQNAAIDWGTVDKSNASTDDLAEGQVNFYVTNDRFSMGNALSKSFDTGTHVLTIALVKSGAVADASITVTGTADGTYSANEQTMINALVADVGTLKDKVNAILASLRTGGVLTA